ncbi:methyl-accepting chemotaxis protein [Photobacterium sp. SDRW27]|uniref:methyl-accepting chemotaxis protein n=1 Tax=Photobacterium obscurum TaxID=2829490 RepID=UPI002244E3BD|nr:methyl-accepting chemotaxis protein [Photobacterium obscurum]MCW8331157.1 methyl-accepting chemotaxis protein [Photobacterium obscurum]
MNVNKLSIKAKLLFLIFLISTIFIFSSFYIKSANNKVANNFNQFYNHTFSVTISFENIKSTQTDIMLNIRGLQISYLLGLTQQIDGYIEEVNSSIRTTPALMENLKNEFTGEIAQIHKLESQINTFQEKSQAFIKAMQISENNKAPYPVFAAFRDSYVELEKQFELLTQLNNKNADDSYLEASESISNADLMFYVSIVVALLVAALIAVLFSNKMIHNINRVKDAAVDLSKGKLTTHCDVEGGDEIALLSDALNTTIQNLNNTLMAISQSTRVVTHNSQSLLEANSNIQNASVEVSDNTVQAVTAIEELTITSKDIANNISDTAHTSDTMTALAHKGIESSTETKDAVIELVQNLDQTSGVVGQLRDESTKIESILDVIRGISEQTNLLALNAAIEAARAGEQGRGFAVVADEVRSLAQRSQSSVNEIETMLTQLSSACEHAVQMMAASTEIATSAEDRVVASNQMIEEILAMIQQVNVQTQQIATAAEEQSSVAAEISTNMHVVQELSTKAAQISSDTVASSNEMNQVSQQVQEQVRFFELR